MPVGAAAGGGGGGRANAVHISFRALPRAPMLSAIAARAGRLPGSLHNAARGGVLHHAPHAAASSSAAATSAAGDVYDVVVVGAGIVGAALACRLGEPTAAHGV